MNAQPHVEASATAARPHAAVALFIAATLATAAACTVLAFQWRAETFPYDLLAFIAIAAITDLREVRLPVVGHVTLSFVPVLAALIVFGLWPALIVAAASGLATIAVTHDPQKIAFNVGNYVLSTFLAGIVFLAFTPPDPAFAETVLPAFAATAVDFLANTVVLAAVIAVADGGRVLKIWRDNYEWGLPSYMTGATLSLFVAWLYLKLGVAGLLLGLPPLYLIYYSYDVYVVRARERTRHSKEVASFRDGLAAAVNSQKELRELQRKVAAEIERARVIQQDLLPREAPSVPGLEIAHRIEFMDEMGGDYYDFLPLPDGRLGIVCGDVMGKGLAAALIMTMARSLIHSAAASGASPGAVLAETNDALTRDLEGQQAPCFLTLLYGVYSPDEQRLVVANGGHNPLLVIGSEGVRQVRSGGSLLGMREGLEFPEEVVELDCGETFALYTDGLTEARDPQRALLGPQGLIAILQATSRSPVHEMLETAWSAIDEFRDGAAQSDDATLLLGRVKG